MVAEGCVSCFQKSTAFSSLGSDSLQAKIAEERILNLSEVHLAANLRMCKCPHTDGEPAGGRNSSYFVTIGGKRIQRNSSYIVTASVQLFDD